MDMATFRKKLIASLSDAFGKLKTHRLIGADWDRIYHLCENKYKSWDWRFGRSPDFTVRHKFKYNGQKIEGAVHVSGGMITKMAISNGAVSQDGIDDLRSKLIGERYDLNLMKNLLY
jgi:lipoate-protein ligase A